MILLIILFTSIYMSLILYALNYGMEFSSAHFTLIMVAIMFIVFGACLPKCKQNYTIGIKVTWALNDEENWNMTHRLAGKVWVISGILILFTIFLPEEAASVFLIIELLIICFVPVIYSYLFYRKKKATGANVHTSTQWPINGQKSWYGKFSLIITIVICTIVGVIMFAGNINVVYNDTDFTLEASYWQDLTLEYNEIDSIEYRDYEIDGSRTAGYGSARLLMGTFENDEFGYYTRYTYTGCDASIVIEIEDNVYVISGKNAAETKAVYEELSNRINQN